MPFYIYGTMSIGREIERIETDIALVHQAIEAGCWLHTARGYSSMANFNLLGRALRSSSRPAPPVIAKIRCYEPRTLVWDVEDTLQLLGVERLAIAQLSTNSRKDKKALARDFLAHGPMYEACQRLHDRGLVGSFVLECFINCSHEAIQLLQRDLIDGVAYRFSVIDREVTNPLNHLLNEARIATISIRTVGGGLIFEGPRRRLISEDPDHYYVPRLRDLEPVFERSGCKDWLTFSFAYLAAHERLRGTIGGTSNPDNLRCFIEAARDVKPLDAQLTAEIEALQNKWMGEF